MYNFGVRRFEKSKECVRHVGICIQCYVLKWSRTVDWIMQVKCCVHEGDKCTWKWLNILHKIKLKNGALWETNGTSKEMRIHSSKNYTRTLMWDTNYTFCRLSTTRWFKYDRDKLWLIYTQSVPVIFEPPCMFEEHKVYIPFSKFLYSTIALYNGCCQYHLYDTLQKRNAETLNTTSVNSVDWIAVGCNVSHQLFVLIDACRVFD
jgi:hypothetical protein